MGTSAFFNVKSAEHLIGSVYPAGQSFKDWCIDGERTISLMRLIDKFGRRFMKWGHFLSELDTLALIIRSDHSSVTSEDFESEKALIEEILSMSKEFNLTQSTRIAEKAHASWNIEGFTRMVEDHTFSHLAETVRSEVSSVWMMRMSEVEADLFNNLEPFGADVPMRFPEAIGDIEEAAKCLALGCATACVFHLMRVLERGVQALGLKFGYTIALEKEWYPILTNVNGALNKLPASAEKNRFSEMTAYLISVKTAWRNPTMHPRASYSTDEAREIFNDARRFMISLTKVL